MNGVLTFAACQFSESFQPRRNAAVILRYMERAAGAGAQLLHTHEGALSGYLSNRGAPKAADYDWPALRHATGRIMDQAKKLRLTVLLGSAHPLSGARLPANCVYLIGPDGRIADRYDKRFLTAGDLKAYTPGNRFVIFNRSGVRCAILICFDLRFPELYRRLRKLGVQAVFQSFNNGSTDGPGIHTQIMRQTMQAHAGINYFWVSATNSSAYFSRWPSVFIQPDGRIIQSLRQNAAGLMICTIDTRKGLYDASAPFRAAAMAGKLHSGKLVNDPRQKNRRCL
jgi:predicted amidohydrolase